MDLGQLDKVGTLGLAVMVVGLIRFISLIRNGEFVTKREHDREIARGDRLELRLDKALEYGDRALGAGEVLRDQPPAKR